MSEDSPKLKVLLVDDDADEVWALGRFLTRKGFSVVTCGDGAEAVALLAKTQFDTVITDVRMPGLIGLALIEWLNQNRPGIRVVVMTALGSPTVQEIVQRKGAILYLEKSVDPDLLVRVLTKRARADSFTGVVDDIDLFDYVQLLLVTNRRALLEVVSTEGERGRLHIDGGRVRHAACGEAQGEAAFFRCLGFEGGRFASVPWQEPERDTIDRKGEYLLMEAARLKDERARTGTGKPPSLVPPSDPAMFDVEWEAALPPESTKKVNKQDG